MPKKKEENVVYDKELQDIYVLQKKLKTTITKIQKTLNAEENSNKIETIVELLNKLYADVDKHIYNDKNDVLYHYKHYFLSIINELEEEKEFNRRQTKPIRTSVKPYNEKVYSKLNYLFRKKAMLTEEEIEEQYERDLENLNQKYNMFIDLIDWLNSNGFSIIPEKTLFCAFLGISVEKYNDMLKKSADSNVRNLFKNIDDYFTTSQFGGLIADSRQSLERIQKTEKYGQEMRQTQPDNLTLVQNNSISYADIMRDVLSQSKTIGIRKNEAIETITEEQKD